MKILAVAAFLFFPTLSFSQTKAASAKADTTQLEEVVVVSSRFREKKRNVAQQVQVITADRLQRLNASSTAAVLQETPGVMVQRSQLGGGSPIIRGFEASRVLLVVDGVRLNNAIYRGGHLQNVITMDHNSLERMEVGFGPSSVIYGSDALGGVIHFHTKQPQLNKTSLSAFTRYATASDERTGGFSFNFGGEKWSSFSSVTFSDFGDLRQGANSNQPGTEAWKRTFYVERKDGQDQIIANDKPNLQKQSGYRQLDILQKFLIKNSDRVTQVVNLQFSTSSDVPRYDRLAQNQNNLPAYAEWYYGPQKRLLTAYQLQLNGFSDWFNRANITAAYQKIQESRHDRRLDNLNLNNRQEDLDIFSLNADFNQAWDQHSLSYGSELNHNKVKSSAYRSNVVTGARTPLDTRYPDGGSEVFSAAAFLSHRYEISPKLSLNEGVRISHVNLQSRFDDQSFFPFPFSSVKQSNTALSGNVSLIYRPAQLWKISLLGSTGFRAPNVDDLAKVFESVPGQVIVPNPDLKPEVTYNAEFGLSRSLDRGSEINMTGFYTWYRNAITTQPYSFNGQDQIIYNDQLSDVTANVNAGRAYLYGLSADISTLLIHNIRLKTSATYTFARITSTNPEQPLDHIPPFFASGNLAWQQGPYEAEFYAQYNSRKKLKDYNPAGEDNLAQATVFGMPSWYTLNLRTGYQFNKRLKFQAGLENILDRNYRVFASGISAPGRNLILSLRGNF